MTIAPIGCMAVDADTVAAIRAAIRGYRARHADALPRCVYVRPDADAPDAVDGVEVRRNAHVGLRQALAAAE